MSRKPVSRKEYESLLERIEDLEDAQSARAVLAGTKAEDFLPAPLVKRMIEGEHPLSIWREHRKLTAAALGRKAGVATSDIDAIESGGNPGSIATMRALAEALRVRPEDITNGRRRRSGKTAIRRPSRSAAS